MRGVDGGQSCHRLVRLLRKPNELAGQGNLGADRRLGVGGGRVAGPHLDLAHGERRPGVGDGEGAGRIECGGEEEAWDAVSRVRVGHDVPEGNAGGGIERGQNSPPRRADEPPGESRCVDRVGPAGD